MKLKRIKITNFRSIESLDLHIEDDITTLVGANEHGKSNILDAINLLDNDVNYDLATDLRIDGGAKKYYPNIKYYIELDNIERKQIQDSAQDAYPPTQIINPDSTVTEGKPEKEIKLKDIPQLVEYDLFIKKEDQKTYYRLNVSDEDIKKSIYTFIKNDVSESIIYFDEFNDRLDSIISKESILNSEDNPIVQGLLKVCGLDGREEQIFTDEIEIRQLLDKAPEKITKAEVDEIICWLTGYSKSKLKTQIDREVNFETFFKQAPKLNPARQLITGLICGVRIEEIEDDLMREIRYLDKLIDELAKGRSMEKILRQL